MRFAQAYKPEVGRFKDYVAKPKENGYRCLHICMRAGDGSVFEVQIRSVAMDRHAELGNAAHWLYKKDGREADRESVMFDWWDRIRRWPGNAAQRFVSEIH